MSSDDTVTVLGTGRVTAAPDTLVLDLRLSAQGRTVAEALTALTRASHDATGALPDAAARTSGLGVHPRHDHEGRQVGHTAYQSLTVRVGDPTAAGDLVHRLGEAVGDALGVDGLRQEVAEPSGLQREARDRAFADARERAEQYAALAGRDLGTVVRVREGVGAGPLPRGLEDARFAMASGPVVEPADQEVVVMVEVSWALLG